MGGANGNFVGVGGRKLGVVAPHVNGKDPVADAEENADELKNAADEATTREVGYKKDKETNNHGNCCHHCRTLIVMV